MHTPASRALALRTSAVAYPGSAEQISVVRADLGVLLGDCPMADDVVLCASEMATNAVLHSRSGRCRLPARWDQGVSTRKGPPWIMSDHRGLRSGRQWTRWCRG